MEEKEIIKEKTKSETQVKKSEKIKNDVNKIEILKTPNYHKENCKVLSYNKNTKELNINFKGYGIQLKNINLNDVKDYIEVKYTGDVGKNLKIEI